MRMMMAFAPQDEIEGMIAGQAVALCAMTMECARRAMLPDQPHEIAQGHRKAAANTSRAFTELLGALDKKRGKHRHQTVRVEKVMVATGAQALVGIANAGGVGNAEKCEGEPYIKRQYTRTLNATASAQTRSTNHARR